MIGRSTTSPSRLRQRLVQARKRHFDPTHFRPHRRRRAGNGGAVPGAFCGGTPTASLRYAAWCHFQSGTGDFSAIARKRRASGGDGVEPTPSSAVPEVTGHVGWCRTSVA